MKPEQVKRTFDISEYCARRFGDKPAFFQKRGRKWISISCKEYHRLSEELSLGMLTVGVERGDFVATIFNSNCPQWNLIDIALSKIGAIQIPVYPNSSDSDYLYILNQADVKFIFVGDQTAYNKVSALRTSIPGVKQIYSVDKLANVDNYEELLQLGANSPLEMMQHLEKISESITPDDLVSIVYTSGTTGFPKGVMLSHRNLVTNTFAAAEIQPLGLGNRVLSFLPLCHVYERTANYQFQVNGAQIYYCENMKSLMSNFKEVRPHGTTVVPRVLEKIIKLVLVSGQKRNFIIRWTIKWSVRLGFRYKPYKEHGALYDLQNKLAYVTVYRKVRASLGGRINYIGCGGAPVSHKVERFFWACRMPIYQGYGLTEAAPLVSLNYPGHGNYYIGSVGSTIKGVDVKIAKDGEILVKGANVMLGYFKQEKQTQETLVDGWLHTGDIGRMIQGKYLQITGRKKQMFKTSYGKYIVPQAIEGRFSESAVIDFLIVIGEGKHCAGAIICPNFSLLRKMHSFSEKLSNQKLIAQASVRKTIQKEVDKVNRQLGKTERINKHLIVSDEWSPESGELSPTMKIKRSIILKKYNRKIHLLYKGESVY